MKPFQLFLSVAVISIVSFSCNDTVNTDFDKILGTYTGAATYFYTGSPNGTHVQNQDAGTATITVSAVSAKDLTFRISGTGLTADAFEGYGDGVYTWNPDKLNSGTYFAVNNEGTNATTMRDISTRFEISSGSVEMDYGQRVNVDASTENISFQGMK